MKGLILEWRIWLLDELVNNPSFSLPLTWKEVFYLPRNSFELLKEITIVLVWR